MKDFNRVFLIFFCCLFFLSCKNDKSAKTVDDSEIRYRYFNLENSGWKSRLHSQKVDNINFTATEVPIQYYLLKDQGNDNLIKVDSIYQENKNERIIEFVFENDEQSDLLEKKYTNLDYKKAVEYMSFKIQNDFFIVTLKNDTIACSGVLFERDFKVSPHNKILLFFSGINPNDKIQLVYQDNLFNKGILKFRFKEPILNL